jgi:hypothetical protein
MIYCVRAYTIELLHKQLVLGITKRTVAVRKPIEITRVYLPMCHPPNSLLGHRSIIQSSHPVEDVRQFERYAHRESSQ